MIEKSSGGQDPFCKKGPGPPKTFACKTFAYALVFLIATIGANGAILDIGNQKYISAAWTVENGLPQNSVLKLLQTREGYIWLGTEYGLVRFNGITFRVYNRWNTPGIKNDCVRCLFEDKKGASWIGTEGGLTRMKDGTWTTYTTTQGLSHNTVTAITEDTDGTLWIGTGKGIDRLKDGKITHYKYPTDEIGENDTITALMKSGNGTLWIGTAIAGLKQIKNERFQPNPETKIISKNEVTTFYEDRTGAVWIGTDNGLYRNEKVILEGVSIQTIIEDKHGNKWVGTDGNGVYRITKDEIIPITTRQGLPDDFIHILMEDKEDNLWIGTYTAGLVRLKTTAIRDITTTQGLKENKVMAILQDDEGKIWAGTERSGVTILKNKIAIQTLTTADGLTGNKIRTLYQDTEKNIWIGTTTGLNKVTTLNGKYRVTVGATKDGQTSNKITSIYRDRTGADLKIEAIAQKEDRDGQLWVGTNGGGLIRFKKGKPGVPVIYTTKNGLPSDYIFSVTEDPKGNLWISSPKGVFRISNEERRAEKIENFTVSLYDEKEGMRSGECVTGGTPSAWMTKEGKLYIPTNKGIAEFDTGESITPGKKPVVIIENVIADNRSVISDKTGRLSEKTQLIEFYYDVLSYTAPEKIKIRYKLEGYDAQWKETSSQQNRMVYYVNLPPGNYRFKVTACGNGGVWNRDGARYEFQIAAPYYKRAVFYGIILLSLMSIGIGAIYFKTKRKKQPEEKEEPREEPKEKYKTSALLPETVEHVLPRLIRLMEEEKLYLKPDLTLKKLSERLHVHYNHLSQIINERLGQSFNDYINAYRIEEAKKRLVDHREANKTVLEIAYDTGFYSKSVFNTAFKKFTGMTPSEYKKNFFFLPERLDD